MAGHESKMVAPLGSVMGGCGACLLGLLMAVGSADGQDGGRVISEENEMTNQVNFDEIVKAQIEQLSKSRNEATDASAKLVQMKGRAVPGLAEVLKTSKNEQARFFAAYALSHIRDPAAAKALLPLLEDPKSDRKIRLMAIQAASADDLEDSIELLKTLAVDPEDGEMRISALRALSVMKTAWESCEELFVKGLSDERDDIQTLCAKVCYQVATLRIYYASGESKLLELAEKGQVIGVRCNALAALSRMQSSLTVPAIVRLISNPETPAEVNRQAVHACQILTGVPNADVTAVLKWWEKYGKQRYENAKPLEPNAKTTKKDDNNKKADKDSAGTTTPRKKLPEDKPANSGFGGVPMGGAE